MKTKQKEDLTQRILYSFYRRSLRGSERITKYSYKNRCTCQHGCNKSCNVGRLCVDTDRVVVTIPCSASEVPFVIEYLEERMDKRGLCSFPPPSRQWGEV